MRISGWQLTEWEVIPFVETERTVDFSPEDHELVRSLLLFDIC